MQPYADLIPDVRWEIFEHSSHMPHLEEPEAFLRVVADFLDGTVETGAPGARQGSV